MRCAWSVGEIRSVVKLGPFHARVLGSADVWVPNAWILNSSMNTFQSWIPVTDVFGSSVGTINVEFIGTSGIATSTLSPPISLALAINSVEQLYEEVRLGVSALFLRFPRSNVDLLLAACIGSVSSPPRKYSTVFNHRIAVDLSKP